jgi:hypothetical protein
MIDGHHQGRKESLGPVGNVDFLEALEINDLFDRESPLGRLYVSLKEEGFAVEQFWTIREGRSAYYG